MAATSGLALVHAQPPVVSPRGVINAFTQQPAPSAVSPGGVFWINGLNLGPPSEIKAAALPFPTELGDPPVRVRINQRLAPLYSISANRIVAQVPLEVPVGLATIIVERAGQASRPARILIQAPTPAVRTTGDSGFGPAAGREAAGKLTLAVSSLGAAEPAVPTGQAAAGAAPRLAVRTHVGGLPAPTTISHSADRPGQFDIEIEIPAGALPGDVINLSQGGRLSNFVTLGTAARHEMLYVPFPDGTPEIRALQPAGLRSVYLAASGARAADGCYPSFTVDMVAKTMASIDGCVTSGLAQLPSPFVATNDTSTLAAFVGTPAGQNQATDKVRLFNVNGEPKDVTLPSTGQVLAAGPDGVFQAVLTGGAGVITIDGTTGETRTGGAGAINIGGAAGGGGLQLGAGAPTVDLGDGLNRVLSPILGLGNNLRAVVVGDNTDNPTRTKLAILNPQNQVQATRDFPDQWLALASPAPQLLAGIGGAGGPGGPALQNRQSVAALVDAPTRSIFVMARTADSAQHGFVSFKLDSDEKAALPLPNGWFVAACTPQLRVFNVELTRRVGLLGANTADRELKNPCPATGFVLFDLDEANFTPVELPGAGQFSATQGTDELNDFVFGSNIDPARQGAADTLYILDGVTATPFRVDLPPGLNGFSQIRPVRDLNILVGLGRARQAPGDGGIVVFDLERASGTVLNVPDGFATVQLLDIFPATRKVVARGLQTGNTGAQMLIYDLTTSDVTVVPNPPGVAFLGTPPAQAPGAGGAGGGGQPGQPQAPQVVLRSSPRSQTIEAVAYSPERRQTGIAVIRVN